MVKCFGAGCRGQTTMNKKTALPIRAFRTPTEVVVAPAENSSSSSSSSSSSGSSSSSSTSMSTASSSSGRSSSASSASEFVPSKDVLDASPTVVATRAHTHKGEGEGGEHNLGFA